MAMNITEKVNRKKEYDQKRVSDALVNLSGIIVGDSNDSMFSDSHIHNSLGVINAILKSFGIKNDIQESNAQTVYELLESTMQPYGIMYRTVELTDSWYEDAFGTYLGTLTDGRLVALIPGKKGYSYIDNVMKKPVRIDSKNASLINKNAICLYRPLPQKKLNFKDLLDYFLKGIHISDVVKMCMYTLIGALASLLIPMTNSYIYNELVYLNTPYLLIFVFLTMGLTYFFVFILNQMKMIVFGNFGIKIGAEMNTAVMMRLISLPVTFFKNYSGKLTKWIAIMKSLSATIVQITLSVIFGLVMCLVYLCRMITSSKDMAGMMLVFFLIQVIFTAFAAKAYSYQTRKQYEAMAEEEGFVYSMLSGMQKIRISGAENRVFANWVDRYGKVASLSYKPPLIVAFYKPINGIVSVAMTIVSYFLAYRLGMSGADFMVFASIYGMLCGAMTILTESLFQFSNIPSGLDVVKPFLEEEPEIYENKKTVNKLSGGVQLRHVKFRYEQNSPWIMDDFSLDISPGSYVAIVGKSGCGKSTLIRLLLGFEKPDGGIICYGNHNIEDVDIRSIRRRIGIVMQDAELFPGTIRYNISINSPGCGDDKIWKAAQMAGIAETIENLPMRLETIISGNGGGLSGGQKQRIAIARALISDPDMIIFDEATSALDNVSQKAVIDSLDKLKCTRIVVAHRLSTIRTCDRVVMLDKGKIIEDGTYDELIVKDGEFAKLVKRQQLNS